MRLLFKHVQKRRSVSIARLNKIELPTLTDKELEVAGLYYANQMRRELIGQFLGERIANSDVSYNIPQLRLVFGEAFNASYIPTATMEQTF